MNVAWILWMSAALGYETDNLTDRHLPLPDVTAQLDEEVNVQIAAAIEETNARTRCALPPEEAQRALAHAIYLRTAVNEVPVGRKGIASLGYDKYGAWIENAGIPRRSFTDRQDIFGSIKLMESPILKLAGVCSVVQIGDVQVGIDKLEHFFEEGYIGWQRAREGKRPGAQIRWATRTENTIYGLQTSQTFSYGDLRADYDGMVFYASLLDPWTGVARVGADGCLEVAEPFTWRRWVTWEYDEVLNPPVHTAVAQEALTRHLAARRDEYCASFRLWADDDYAAHLARVLATRPPYAGAKAPGRTDPYNLIALCAGWEPPEGASGSGGFHLGTLDVSPAD